MEQRQIERDFLVEDDFPLLIGRGKGVAPVFVFYRARKAVLRPFLQTLRTLDVR